MKIIRPHKVSRNWSLFMLGMVFVLILWGCEGGVSEMNSTSSTDGETGAVAFHVNWGGDGDKVPASSPRIAMSNNCGGQDDVSLIYWVAARVYDDNGQYWSAGTAWRCDVGSGEITGVPTGAKTLVVIGYNYTNFTLYCGVETIYVSAGENDPIDIDAPVFFAEMLSPQNGSSNANADNVLLEWNPAPGAFGYEVWISENSDLSSPVKYGEIVRITGTSFSPTAGSLSSGKTYYWAVLAVDYANDRGYFYDEIWSFTTSSESVTCDDISGDWTISDQEVSNTCEVVSSTPTELDVNVYQTGCNVTVSEGTNIYNGTVDGNNLHWISYVLEDGGITTQAVSLTVAGDSVNGSSSWVWSDSFSSCSGTTTITGSRAGSGGSPPADYFEPNDTLAAAWDNSGFPAGWVNQWLSYISTAGWPTVSDQDSEDWFEISVTADALTVQIECIFTHADGDIDLYLYDGAGVNLGYSEGATDNEDLTYTFSSPGTYYIKVFFYSATGENSYDLRWNAVSSPSTTRNVALFSNTLFVDYDPTGNNYLAEASELQASLEELGHTVTAFTGITSSAISTALIGKDVLVIPAIEKADLDASMDSAARSEIESFVVDGGLLLVFGGFSDYIENLLNNVFPYTLVTGHAYSGIHMSTEGGSHACYSDGPPTLDENDSTYHLSSPPLGAVVVYEDSLGNNIVTSMDYYAGTIVHFGWNWQDALPSPGAQDGGWSEVLEEALTCSQN